MFRIASDVASTSTPTRRVVVVDDEPAVRSLVRRMLEPAGYIVEEVADPAQACAVAETTTLDLLVSDFQMPGMTGDEVARRFRAAQPDLKVLFITGYSDDLFEGQPQLWEGQAFLEKPFSRQELLEATSLLLTGGL
jgi:hypothetical protein